MSGSNVTTGNVSDVIPGNRFTQPEWYIGTICNVIFLLIITWMVVAICIYGKMHRKWRKLDSGDETAGRVTYTSFLCAYLLSYLRTIPDQAAFNVGYEDVTSRACEISMDVSVTGYCLTTIGVFTFLWLKQRSLYQHPAISTICNTTVKVISLGSILVIWIGYTAAALAYLSSDNYDASPRGCVTKPKSEYVVWPIYMTNGIILVGQFLLLFLFIYPLRRNSSSANKKRISKIVKRSAIFAVICVISDFVAMVILAFIVPDTTTRHVTITVYDINMFINLLSILFSFETWKGIVTSPLRQTKEKQPITTSQPRSSNGQQTAESKV